MDNSVYYLTGMGGRLDTGLGQGLLRRGFEIAGRELVGSSESWIFSNNLILLFVIYKATFGKRTHVSLPTFLVPTCFYTHKHKWSLTLVK